MNQLIKVSQELTQRGDEFISQNGPLRFHEKAHELLKKAQLFKHYHYEELVEASFEEGFNKSQNYGAFQFSDLPVTLAMGKNCFVDLYFWRRRPTVIHDHHFTGAFQCLEGVNVDLEFEFIKNKSLGSWHDIGEIKELRSRKLTRGDIAPIDLLDRFIHQNHHQAELTINICFRTPDLGESNLSNYLYSGLRYEKAPELLGRVERLMSYINLGPFDFRKLNLTVDDALSFMIRSYGSRSGSKKFLEVRTYLDHLVREQCGIDIDKMLHQHEEMMDKLESEYN